MAFSTHKLAINLNWSQERTLQKDPRNVEVLIQLTDLYIKTNNEKEAKKTLKEILDIDPYNKEANERLKK